MGSEKVLERWEGLGEKMVSESSFLTKKAVHGKAQTWNLCGAGGHPGELTCPDRKEAGGRGNVESGCRSLERQRS